MLESCGGCVHGEYQNDAVDELRINGTAVPGIESVFPFLFTLHPQENVGQTRADIQLYRVARS